MFTGIIEATEKIIGIRPTSKDCQFIITRPVIFDDLKIGCSIACDGICLTVIELKPKYFNIEVMRETLQKSTAKNWCLGKIINLERALKLNSRLDGHLVQGHIDNKLRIISRLKKEGTDYLNLELPQKERNMLVPQGAIALNGVSLTIANIRPNYFSVALIGHTLEHTNLGTIKTGETVNVEYDILGKYVVSALLTSPLNALLNNNAISQGDKHYEI
ncbi:MAG TPA: riboflavin synthase [Candidatus Cloacimonas sp.]|nr:riboflavin synthase [Candidatus Cloacimonas sp.]